ncbi:hypothetical protein [Actinomadura sp. NTSP31]|uniref:hypothetical protein n=1 Tax=Actinomadura sp. NTSP31 TaxID=1735447 RepID=UPI0035C187E1
MRSRISGRRLLPTALAAASVVAVAAPASAQAAPPPDPAANTTTSTPADNGDCAKAVSVLSVLKLLPNSPDLGKVLCSANTAGKEQAPAAGTAQAPAATGNAQRPAADASAESAQKPQEYNLLGLPVEWPKSLTVHVPTINDHWYVFKSKQ